MKPQPSPVDSRFMAAFAWLALWLLFSPQNSQADTSFASKLSTLRFGHEEFTSFQDGTLDLTKLGQEQFIHAHGEVYFIPGEFVTPRFMDEGSFKAFLVEKKAIKAKLRLSSYPYPLAGTDASFGTFVFRFSNQAARRLSIGFPRYFHPVETFFVDGVSVARVDVVGKIDQDPARNRNIFEYSQPSFAIDVKGEFYLFTHASSPIVKGQNTLNISSFLIGPEQYLNGVMHQSRICRGLISGGFMIMVIFYSFIYSFRRQDSSSLFLAIFAMGSFALSLIYTSNFGLTSQQLLACFTSINLFSICALQFYILEKISFALSRKTHRILQFTAIFIAFSGSIGSFTGIYPLLYSFQILSAGTSFVAILVAIYLGFKYKMSGVLFFVVGGLLALYFQSSLVYGVFQKSEIEVGYKVLMANFCMALALALVNAKEFSIAFKTAARLSRQLQREVDQQTEKLRLQKERLEEQKAELMTTHEILKESDEQKTRFFRSISHELRTPLTLILGTLEDSEDPNRLRRSIEIASRNAKRLYRLVNQLLDFQKIALSKVKLRTERVDLLSFLDGVAGYVKDSCEKNHIAFKFVNLSPEKGGFIVKAQLDALEKIVFNYLGNAIKFSQAGGSIQLEVSSQGAYARIGVRDSGCGIAKDQQDKLFKLFSQIEGPQQQNKQGTGLGLALVKELAIQMEGRVGVESSEGQGATFWLELARLMTEAEQHAFLYVDSEPRNFASIRKQFAAHGMDSQLHCAADAEAASSLLRSYPVQVLMIASNLSDQLGSLMDICESSRPNCWRVLLVDPLAQGSSRSMSTKGIQAIHQLPVDETFMKEALCRFTPNTDQSQMPILDLVYVEDEAFMRNQFATALGVHTLIERYEIIQTFDEYKKLSQAYRIKVLVCDALLADGINGTDILSFAAHTSPDTVRILFTGQTSTEVLSAGIHEGQAQYIIYKPMDFAKELQVIENYIHSSVLEPKLATVTNVEIINREWQLVDFTEPKDSEDIQEILPEVSSGLQSSILVVDDVRDMRIILQDILHDAGYRVFHASNGRTALEFLQQSSSPIDLIITDWMMPVMTGPDFIQELHREPKLASIPTILLTAKSDDQSRSMGLKVGASSYLSKPFDKIEVLSIIENLLELKQRERQLVELNQFISQNVLQRFLPPDLVKDLVAGKAIFDDAAKLQSITVIFADLCNFTSNTEQLGPTKMARILNKFLVSMTDIIFEEGGTIDKFIGDAILIFFGAPTRLDPQEQISKAHRCAIRMQRALDQLNKEWIEQEKHSFQMRVGIHHGPAVVGSFGGKRRSDYTAIGQTVNVAARIESQANPGEILVSSEIRDYLKDGSWESAGNFRLKGVAHELTLYRIIQDEQKSAA